METTQSIGKARPDPATIREKEVLSVEEMAAALGVSRTKAFELVSGGAVKSFRVGRRRLIRRRDFEAFLDELARTGEGEA